MMGMEDDPASFWGLRVTFQGFSLAFATPKLIRRTVEIAPFCVEGHDEFKRFNTTTPFNITTQNHFRVASYYLKYVFFG